MFPEDIKEGMKVYWEDPDDGICSGEYIVKEMKQGDFDQLPWYRLVSEDGSEVEAFHWELSIKKGGII